MITDYHVKLSGNPTIQQFYSGPESGTGFSTREIDRETAERLGDILAAAHEGDSLDLYFKTPASALRNIRDEFERGRNAALSAILTELSELEHSETIGIAVWRPWYTGMVMQGREVEPERRDWDLLDPRDQNLDIGIGTTIMQQLAILIETNVRAEWAMEDAGAVDLFAVAESDTSAEPARIVSIEEALAQGAPILDPLGSGIRLPGDPEYEHWREQHQKRGKPDVYVLPDTPEAEAIAAKDATIKDLRDRLSRAGNVKKRLEQRLELEMVKTQVAAERAAAQTYRLEAEQKDRQLETLQLATSVREQFTAKDNEIARLNRLLDDRDRYHNERYEDLRAQIANGGDKVWEPKYEEVAAALEKVIAERDEQARVTNELREQIARLKRADRAAGFLLFPSGVLGDFGYRAWQSMTSDDYTEPITEQFADIAEDMRLVRLMTYPGNNPDRKGITERLIRVCARACRIHQRHGEVDKAYKNEEDRDDDDTAMIEAQEAAIEAEEISQEAYELRDDERGKIDTKPPQGSMPDEPYRRGF